MAGRRGAELVSGASACTATLLASLLLTGCPLSDDYYVELDNEAGENGSGGSSTTSSGGSSLTSNGSGGTSATDGASSSGGTGTTASGGSSNTGGSGAASASGGSGTGGTAGSGVEQCTRCSGESCDSDSECEDGWAVMATPPEGFEAREKAAYAATDLRLFVWGGLDADGAALDTGALYDPVGDTWEELPVDSNTPSPRHSATAVWTGSVMIVWGGMNGSTTFEDGGMYDLRDDQWLPMSGGPMARAAAAGAWIASSERVAFWGGETATGNLLEGIDFYYPGDDSWQRGNTTQDPGKLRNAAWAGGTLTFWVFGGLRDGSQITGEGSYYSMSSDAWVPIGGWSGSGRSGAFGSIIGLDFYVWGGRDDSGTLATGARYPLGTQSGGSWDTFSSDENAGAPEARSQSHRESGWSFAEDDQMFVLAGLDGSGRYLRDGGVYDIADDAWEPIQNWPSTADHAYGAVVLVPSSELIVWGGRDGDSLTSEGLRYLHP